MDQIKIGRFISDCRKRKNITQAILAEKLNITDRAVSKWETGKSMPDTSIMIDLCNELGISVNELLSGELIEMDNYNEQAEKTLLEMAKKEEENNKRLLLCEYIIGFGSVIFFILVLFFSIFFIETVAIKIGVIVAAFIIFYAGILFGLKIETEVGYYKCRKCGEKYVPSFKSTLFAMHIGRTRYMKCPKCGKKSWNKKVLTK